MPNSDLMISDLLSTRTLVDEVSPAAAARDCFLAFFVVLTRPFVGPFFLSRFVDIAPPYSSLRLAALPTIARSSRVRGFAHDRGQSDSFALINAANSLDITRTLHRCRIRIRPYWAGHDGLAAEAGSLDFSQTQAAAGVPNRAPLVVS